MKIIIFGATGTIGKNIVSALEAGNEIVKVGKSNGDYQADISDPESIKRLFDKVGKVDAIIGATGDVAFAPVGSLTREQWDVGINSKFLGQVNLIQIGKDYLNENGSITLTSGILTDEYINAGASATAINRAIEGFAQAAAAEYPQKLRINVVSPTVLEESVTIYGDFFPGFVPVPGAKVAQAYKKSVLGVESGKVYRVE